MSPDRCLLGLVPLVAEHCANPQRRQIQSCLQALLMQAAVHGMGDEAFPGRVAQALGVEPATRPAAIAVLPDARQKAPGSSPAMVSWPSTGNPSPAPLRSPSPSRGPDGVRLTRQANPR
ncbi:hypothetical protein ACFQS7_08175 [Dankookia sp. GCM10030260]|uniref:hypothetical protein n=1 Tax=Dankookia sp. GCM10030260 TaxID=3273390 RepID=UPI0036070195